MIIVIVDRILGEAFGDYHANATVSKNHPLQSPHLGSINPRARSSFGTERIAVNPSINCALTVSGWGAERVWCAGRCSVVKNNANLLLLTGRTGTQIGQREEDAHLCFFCVYRIVTTARLKIRAYGKGSHKK